MGHGGSTDVRVFSLNLPPPPREASIVMPPAATKPHTADEPEIESRLRLRSSLTHEAWLVILDSSATRRPIFASDRQIFLSLTHEDSETRETRLRPSPSEEDSGCDVERSRTHPNTLRTFNIFFTDALSHCYEM
jgi:hypothetical protein